MSPAEAGQQKKVWQTDRQTENGKVFPLCQLANAGDTKMWVTHVC